ncbi:carbohydrate ABC transporter membrane protein 2, CUT1 family [Ruania alba]|uniref:Carbohydrate ABC transporter membrane protein 2, CUT1 family n=2 Tax=Ruania alba TaxID=648782 RepID=A0A1H5LKS9_9MICO|nr:carbohydrate ABC transporter membrane protein 2, CUT1 family [Ruania alba]
MKRERTMRWVTGIAAIAVSIVVFILPFVFILLQAAKTRRGAAELSFSWPTEWVFLDNLIEVITQRDFIVARAFVNSTVLTVVSVTVLVVIAAMVGFVMQRRASTIRTVANFFVLAGLIVPPAVVPTVWVLQTVGLFGTLPGLILIEITFGLAFSILLFRAFVSTIPRSLDEAAIIDGASSFRLFFSVIIPLMRPIAITVIVVQSVAIFNDFANPLYFLPGDDNATVQLTLYNFQSRSSNQWNLLFMDILLITIPPLIMYIFFNRQIVAGMTSGAVKG